MACHAEREWLVERALVRRRVLKLALSLVALSLAGCSSLLGFDDFEDTGAGVDARSDGSGRDPNAIHVDGTVVYSDGGALANVGVDGFDRAGNQIASQVTTNADGMFTLDLPKTNGSVDGYLHYSNGAMRDVYQHFDGPISSDFSVIVPMLTDVEVSTLAAQGNVNLVANTGIMIVDTRVAGVVVQLDGGTVRYFKPGTQDLDPMATESSDNMTAIVFNLPDGIYKPHASTKAENRPYAVEPNSVALVTLE